MDTEPQGEKSAADSEYETSFSSFSGQSKSKTTQDFPLPSKNYHPKGYLHSLLIRCVQRDHEKRLTVEEAINHAYFDKYRAEFESGELAKARKSDFKEFMSEKELLFNTVRLEFLQ
jgi:serine/threonine protein kinase